MKNQNTLLWIIVIIALVVLFVFWSNNQKSGIERIQETSMHGDETQDDSVKRIDLGVRSSEGSSSGGSITHHIRIPRYPYWRYPRWRIPRWRRPRFGYPRYPPTGRHHFPDEAQCEQDCSYVPTGYSYWGVPSGYEFKCETTADGYPTRGCKNELSEPGSTSYDCKRERSISGRLCMDKID